MAICVYCRQQLTADEPAEHVIPQGFGTFEPNLTLHCVCCECNNYFGRTFEWAARNSSVEGVLRLNHGLGRGEIGNIGTKGIEFRINESSAWKGARVVLAGGPGLAVFETWGLQPTHFYSALVITARGNDDFYPAVMLWGLERVARRT
jgi:hypothetical protein